ncbi:hypothetical protein ARALYDRAFT_904335 [Arabidopsis lyrata subsp. lyrata]|uniref:Uncharacterized protein n=1 Tax=Arabidopsis lyrata subsp. lyrata TaxID=81972 RepID=D7LLR1_ARALL|nr:hypothetical protein ARALYDRAFT_904335 [Arabidopsis lyrata subsp. lyrata]
MKTRGGKGKRGRGSKIPPQNRPTSSQPVRVESKTLNRRPRGLPSHYEFTPANRQAPLQDSEQEPIAQPPTGPTIRDYPPPTQLFQSGEGSPRGSGSTPFRASGSTQPRSGGSVHRLASNQSPAPVQREAYNQSPAPVQREASNQSPASVQPEASNPPPRQASNPPPRASVSHHSSQAQNSHAEEDEDEEAEANYERESTLPEDSLATLHELLLQPGREKFTTVISPTFEPGTYW